MVLVILRKISKLGYNLKGGLGYSPNEASTFFVNGGFYSRQPYLDNIFADIRNSNAIVSPEIENEEVLSYEAGYRYNKGNLRINVDVYRTDWGNLLFQLEVKLQMRMEQMYSLQTVLQT